MYNKQFNSCSPLSTLYFFPSISTKSGFQRLMEQYDSLSKCATTILLPHLIYINSNFSQKIKIHSFSIQSPNTPSNRVPSRCTESQPILFHTDDISMPSFDLVSVDQ